jgi:hypothetical protein
MLFWTGVLLIASAADVTPRIIVDTDLRSDVDDAGTLALVNALSDRGECEADRRDRQPDRSAHRRRD